MASRGTIMAVLTQEQKNTFWRDGVLIVEEAVTPKELAMMRAEFSNWLKESLAHQEDYGETIDGRARFDLQPGHSEKTPKGAFLHFHCVCFFRVLFGI